MITHASEIGKSIDDLYSIRQIRDYGEFVKHIDYENRKEEDYALLRELTKK